MALSEGCFDVFLKKKTKKKFFSPQWRPVWLISMFFKFLAHKALVMKHLWTPVGELLPSLVWPTSHAHHWIINKCKLDCVTAALCSHATLAQSQIETKRKLICYKWEHFSAPDNYSHLSWLYFLIQPFSRKIILNAALLIVCVSFHSCGFVLRPNEKGQNAMITAGTG